MEVKYRLRLHRYYLSAEEVKHWESQVVTKTLIPTPPIASVIVDMGWGCWVTDGEKYLCVFWDELWQEPTDQAELVPAAPNGPEPFRELANALPPAHRGPL